MVDEAAAALVPGPVATTALATLVVTDETLLDGLTSGERTAGVALRSDITFDGTTATGTAKFVLGGLADGLLVLPAGADVDLRRRHGGRRHRRPPGGHRLLPAAGERRAASAPATVIELPYQRVVDLAATVLAAEASGLARWMLDTATEYAKVREQFGKPIGSFQAVKHMCAEMLLRSQQIAVAAADAANAVADASTTSCRSPSPSPRPSASRPRRSTPATASRCSAASASPGSTTRTSTCAGRTPTPSSSAGSRSGCRRCAQLTRAGVRRQLHVDVTDAEDIRAEVAATVADIAALPEEKRQVALAETGLMAPHWPKPYGRDASPAEQLVIDQELEAAGVVRPDISIGWWAAPTILGHGSPEQIEKFIPGTLTGEVYWCQLFSEPGAGSDLAALRTKAVRATREWTAGC